MNYKEKIEEIDTIINLYKDDPADGLRNKIWAWHTRLLEQAQRDAVEGFWKWLEQSPLVIGVDAVGNEPEQYLNQTKEDSEIH